MKPDMHRIENEWLQVGVSDYGAELCRIYNKEEDREILWSADPAYWNRHAPVLFPFVGKVTDGFYTYEGIKYPMGQHGFARDRVFVPVRCTETEIVHRLEADEESKKIYPFDFILEITHKLDGKRVTVKWKVTNPGDRRLYFSIGGHPAFCVPGLEEYLLSFDGQSSLTRVAIDKETAGVDTEHPETLWLDHGLLPMSGRTFERDALIFDGGQVKKVGLVAKDGRPYVTLYCPDALSVGVWTVADDEAPFVCLEPWIGRCDNSNFRGELKDKYDIQRLEPGGIFESAYELVIGE